MKVTFLGTGTSFGIPIPGCRCRVCGSTKSKNRRLRPAVLVSTGGKNILIDTPPELRIQLVENFVDRIDAILFTHCHADHVYGLDDIRVFSMVKRMPVYGSPNTLNEIKRIFPYIFIRTQQGGGKPKLKLTGVHGRFRFSGITIIPLPVFHGKRSVFGFRIGAFAYIPDCSAIPAATFVLLRDLDVLALDGLRKEPHPTHFSLDQAIEAARRIGARQTFLTHIS
ncbi:MAG: MBL fold metallo-hydrolase, partial [Candidatus Raymondbacteria bacterium RifOxyB12_full_50_8]